MTEDPFSKEEQVPHFYRQSLAYEFYKEGDFEKAEQLIQLNVDHLNRLIEKNTGSEQEKKNDKLNLDQSLSDLTMIQKRSWNEFKPLIREDRGE